MATIAYIRSDKYFDATGEQLQRLNAYALGKNITIEDEFIDHISQNKRISERTQVSDYFQSQKGSTVLVYDVWVLSSNVEDLTQMFSCMIKNKFTLHFVKQSVVITHESSATLVLGLIDQLRKTMQEEKKSIGRPKGSKSSSKFDMYVHDIIICLREKKSVSEIARLLGVSRSSLKDYVMSRELKQVALNSLVELDEETAKQQVVDSLICPNTKRKVVNE